MANFVSFSQNSEDVMLWRAFQSIEAGFYIDLGAGDPKRDSVTAAFYARGWHGINVEPNPDIFRQLISVRERDINLNLAAGASAGEVELFIVEDDDRLSTTKQDIAGQHGQVGHGVRRARTPVRPLRDLCAEYVSGPIHFLKIDVEGAEAEAIRGADFSHWRPWVILVEAIDPATLLPSHAEWEGMLLEAGYHFVYFDGLNRFYVADEQAERLDGHFTSPPNVRDAFVRDAEAVAMNLQRIEAEHAAVVANLHTTAYGLRAERDACIASRNETAAALRDAEDKASGTAPLAEIERLTAERNGWMQELFETNRYAAYLAQERQSLLERVTPLQAYADNVEQAFSRAQAEIERLNDLAADQAALQAYADNVQRALDLTEVHAGNLQRTLDLGQAHTDNVQRALDLAQVEIVQLRDKVAAMHRSTSWHMTKPLRALQRLLTGRRQD